MNPDSSTPLDKLLAELLKAGLSDETLRALILGLLAVYGLVKFDRIVNRIVDKWLGVTPQSASPSPVPIGTPSPEQQSDLIRDYYRDLMTVRMSESLQQSLRRLQEIEDLLQQRDWQYGRQDDPPLPPG